MAVATALTAVALAAALAGRGCLAGAEDRTPDGAVRAFAAAAQTGNRDAMFALLALLLREQSVRTPYLAVPIW